MYGGWEREFKNQREKSLKELLQIKRNNASKISQGNKTGAYSS